MTLLNSQRPIAEYLDRTADENRILYNWSKIEAKRRRHALLIRTVPAAVALLLLSTALFALLYRHDSPSASTPPADGPLTLANQPMISVFSVPPDSAAPDRVSLSDRSRLTVSPGATLQVVENSDEKFRTALLSGRVRFDVNPNRKRTWIIDAGVAEVHVVGTEFTVDRTQEALTVRVFRGTVHVRPVPFEGEITELSAGRSQQWSVAYTVQQETATAASPPASTPAVSTESAPSRPRQKPQATVAPRAERPATPAASTSSLAGMGASDAANEMLEAVDRARNEGRYPKAAALLSRLLRTFPDDPAAGLAALTLARLRLDRLDRPRAAAEAFQIAANADTLPRALREQAAARTVEAFRRAGDLPSARAMRDRYRRQYPTGAWTDAVERWGADTE